MSISYQAGWRAFGRLIVSGPEALAKANRVARSVLGRRGRPQFVRTGACISSSAGMPATRLLHRASQARCCCSLPCAITTSGRSTRALRRSSFRACSARSPAFPTSRIRAARAHPKSWRSGPRWCRESAVRERVLIGDEEISIGVEGSGVSQVRGFESSRVPPAPYHGVFSGRTIRVSLVRLCLARSGDKGRHGQHRRHRAVGGDL